MNRLANNLTVVQESATVALADQVRRLKAAGTEVIGLQTGDPDFATPAPIVQMAYRALAEGHTHYCDSRGLPELRRLVSEDIWKNFGASYDPESEILITCGGVHAYQCAIAAIVNANDEVLVPEPAWMPHVNAIRVVGGVPVCVPGRPEHTFVPSIESLDAWVTSRTKAVLINSPCNPTGAVAGKNYLRQLFEFAVRHDLYVISDEVYHKILFDGATHTSIASFNNQTPRTLLVNSFSKSYAMTGWRLGYLAAPAAVVSQALKCSQYTVTCIQPFAQKAATVALTDIAVQESCREMVNEYAERRKMVMNLWNASLVDGVRILPPQGAFYFFIDIRGLGISSEAAASSLLNDFKVAMVPGSAYGRSGEGFLRMTIAAPQAQIREGFSRFLDWAERTGRTR
jgi:aspartate/methionine/tyrosine aminotransferase